MKPIEWKDIALHSGGGLLLAALLCLTFGPDRAAPINCAFWLGWEAGQKPDRLRIFTHPQSLLEWLCPWAAGFAVVGLWP